MPLIAPLLVDMGLNASLVAASVLSARLAFFWYRFIKDKAL